MNKTWSSKSEHTWAFKTCVRVGSRRIVMSIIQQSKSCSDEDTGKEGPSVYKVTIFVVQIALLLETCIDGLILMQFAWFLESSTDFKDISLCCRFVMFFPSHTIFKQLWWVFAFAVFVTVAQAFYFSSIAYFRHFNHFNNQLQCPLFDHELLWFYAKDAVSFPAF